MSSPKVSAILAVYNSEKTIEPALNSLIKQSQKVEIIVVDDGSTDTTKSLVNKIIELNQKDNIKLLKQKHGGPALARNLGASHAEGDTLLFVDADMVFDPDYVRDLIAPIEAGVAIGTYTVDERVANWDNPLARCWNIQEGWQTGKRFPAKIGPATDFRAIRKIDFNKVAGFDNIGYTDTWSLFAKLGVRPLPTHAVCYHNNPGDLGSVYRQAKWAAKRHYKLGILGVAVALLRTSFIPSLILGIVKSLRHSTTQFLIFKLVYDFGRFVGICEMVLTGKLTK
jgi:glycosyltransferase involved in cell wall biosynthesis